MHDSGNTNQFNQTIVPTSIWSTSREKITLILPSPTKAPLHTFPHRENDTY